jgi:AcrR family transcriptional regulator
MNPGTVRFMGSPATVSEAQSAGGVREIRRQETRARLFAAALAEIGRSGLAGANVSAIASAAGVVRGTFYFHFPTKEHVLVELERSEEVRIVEELGAAQSEADDLGSVLSLLVRRVSAAERRLGPVLFRDMLGLHFSSTRPAEDQLVEHPLAECVIAAITSAQLQGRVAPNQDAGELAMFFLTGLFALLATGVRDAALSRYVITIVKGMESR